MQWAEIRETYPNEWLVIEAVESHMEEQFFVVDDVSVLKRCSDGAAAYKTYREIHQNHPHREVIFIHTSQPQLRIEERRWFGIRASV